MRRLALINSSVVLLEAADLLGLAADGVRANRGVAAMSRTITIKISGHGPDTDAPTAEDLLDQLRDYLEILKGVETAIADDGKNAIEWRIVDASKNSPLQIQLESFSREYAVNIDRRVDAVARGVAAGLALLEERAERPPFFTETVLDRVERVFERVTNGLNLSDIDFGPGIPAVSVTPAIANSALKNARIVQNPVERAYSELGAVEGFFSAIERDGYGRSILRMRLRISGDVVKCILSGKALDVVDRHYIGEVFRGQRLLVTGTVRYKALGLVSQIEANDIRFFPARSEQLGVDAILDESFTGGLTTEEYLARLRDGNLS